MVERIQDMLDKIELRLIQIDRIDYAFDPKDGAILEPTFVLVYESQDDADVFNVTVNVMGERLKELGLHEHEFFPGWAPEHEKADQ
jgi:hypothetical protein